MTAGLLWAHSTSASALHQGVSSQSIHLGSVLALQGKAKGLGKGMQHGLNAALQGKIVKKRKIQISFENDFYVPSKSIAGTKKLLKQGIFLMIGNVGTPTAKITLPILKEQGTPAVGFFTGADLLRQPHPQPIVNYRASYIQETEAIIKEAIRNGLQPTQICAYVQNDAYGMAGLKGIMLAMQEVNAPHSMLEAYQKLLLMEGEDPPRNNIGPVGVYTRNTRQVLKGFQSLKNWEQKTGYHCKLVVTVGVYANIAHFSRNAKSKGEHWLLSAVSFTGAENFMKDLKRYNATEKVIMTQVVPLLDSQLPIVLEAKKALGDQFGFVSLEGYLVGKMTLKILQAMPGELTRKNFMDQVQKTKLDLGGVSIDFTKNRKQGSNLVISSYLTPTGFQKMTPKIWELMLNFSN
ncbi:MAG: branched-chain amino acid ABC transporter substrate-binding protein [SAR324 cluster bacterium]|uniref:Branched-chain amino acid ABC transporter substrate-binding protein n=1 Tax=SAR324 cluster bacterium TaxID=2024889 RepID=A0A2A4SV24_9DELT|nr:MAG: branched-chain amino acid ABC transporter substrate-binding protein [SAR324 cluster bacterium]